MISSFANEMLFDEGSPPESFGDISTNFISSGNKNNNDNDDSSNQDVAKMVRSRNFKNFGSVRSYARRLFRVILA